MTLAGGGGTNLVVPLAVAGGSPAASLRFLVFPAVTFLAGEVGAGPAAEVILAASSAVPVSGLSYTKEISR